MLKLTKTRFLIGPAMLALSTLSACACLPAAKIADTEQPEQTNEVALARARESENKMISHDHPLSWTVNAEPKSDAQQAIVNKDFRLLAFAGRAISIPGIDFAEYPLEHLQQQCGYRLLKGTGDVLRIGEQSALRTKTHDYAVIYNQYMLAACNAP